MAPAKKVFGPIRFEVWPELGEVDMSVKDSDGYVFAAENHGVESAQVDVEDLEQAALWLDERRRESMHFDEFEPGTCLVVSDVRESMQRELDRLYGKFTIDHEYAPGGNTLSTVRIEFKTMSERSYRAVRALVKLLDLEKAG